MDLAFDDYLSNLSKQREPAEAYFPYEFGFIEERRWRHLEGSMIVDDLRELTNRIHAWHQNLIRWEAWERVKPRTEEFNQYDVQREFSETIMYFCLSMPSAFRDALVFVGTRALHQLRLNLEADYPDSLVGDPTPSDPKPRPLNRRQKETRLKNLANSIPNSGDFIRSVHLLDDQEYRDATLDYRNLNNHAIGPRISLGHVGFVSRSVVEADELEEQPDGTCLLVKVPGKFVPSYGFGGLPPLDSVATREKNLEQYRRARVAYVQLLQLTKAQCKKMALAD